MQSRQVVPLMLVTAMLILAGCLDTTPRQEDAGSFSMVPATEAAVPLVVHEAPDPGAATVTVHDDGGLDVQVPDSLLAAGEDTLSGWLTFQAPLDARGPHKVVVQVDAGDDVRHLTYTVDVQEAEPAVQEGDVAQVHITMRSQAGELLWTTEQEVHEGEIARSPVYEPPEQDGPIDLPAVSGQLDAMILEALFAIGPGQQITVPIPEYFGPVAEEQEMPRYEPVPRMQQQQRSYEFPRAQGEQDGTIPPGAEEGDPVEVPGFPFDFVIEGFGEHEQMGETVTITANVTEGTTFTPYEEWPDAAEVVALDEDTIHIRVTPAYGPGERFTWVPGWEDATEISDMDDEVIELHHTPQEGTTFTDDGGMEPVEAKVTHVADDVIVVERENPHPHAGETIHLDLLVVEASPMDAAGSGAGAGAG